MFFFHFRELNEISSAEPQRAFAEPQRAHAEPQRRSFVKWKFEILSLIYTQILYWQARAAEKIGENSLPFDISNVSESKIMIEIFLRKRKKFKMTSFFLNPGTLKKLFF